MVTRGKNAYTHLAFGGVTFVVAMNGRDFRWYNCICRRFKRLGVRVDYVPALCTHRPLWEALPGMVHSALGTGGESLGTLRPKRFAWI